MTSPQMTFRIRRMMFITFYGSGLGRICCSQAESLQISLQDGSYSANQLTQFGQQRNTLREFHMAMVYIPTKRTYNLPSGELTCCYGKWPFIVDFHGFSHKKHGDFPWQNVSSSEGKREHMGKSSVIIIIIL